ncbi:MAG TPA: DM13 domain-containing protein, partial [Roseiflexaceae bacterium]|nr:DM13 domain-containing protein [Roseiflexaceae bacterium]
EQPTQATMTDMPADMMVSRWQGNFVAGSVPADSVRGMAEIVHNEDGSYTLKLTNFESSRGPDVLVMLAPGAMPGDDMHMYKEIAQLAHPTGDQEYQLPAGLEPAAFGSVVIWCRSANAIFGYATLMPEQHG